jgi:hypothetical protein
LRLSKDENEVSRVLDKNLFASCVEAQKRTAEYRITNAEGNNRSYGRK